MEDGFADVSCREFLVLLLDDLALYPPGCEEKGKIHDCGSNGYMDWSQPRVRENPREFGGCCEVFSEVCLGADFEKASFEENQLQEVDEKPHEGKAKKGGDEVGFCDGFDAFGQWHPDLTGQNESFYQDNGNQCEECRRKIDGDNGQPRIRKSHLRPNPNDVSFA